MSISPIKVLKGISSYFTGNRLCILMYHDISDDLKDQWAVTQNQFIDQMRWLKENNYDILSLGQALEKLQSGRISERSVVLSFDDGYKDFLEIIVPVLRNFEFNATLFILANEAGGISHWKSAGLEKPVLSWEEITRIVEMGFEIGSHGLTHRNLMYLQSDEMNKEIKDSKSIIEDKIKKPVIAFAYPFGKYEYRTEKVVRKAGYRCAVGVGSTMANGPETNLFRLQRVAIEQNDSLSNFIGKLTRHRYFSKNLRNFINERFASFKRK